MSTMTLNPMTVNPMTVNRAIPSRATNRPSTPSALRLTRRGRAVLTTLGALVLLVAVAAVVLLAGGSAAAGRDARPLPVRYHVVLPGETLWQIAGEVDSSGDPRDAVARIRELNHLESASLSTGTRLVLPVLG